MLTRLRIFSGAWFLQRQQQSPTGSVQYTVALPFNSRCQQCRFASCRILTLYSFLQMSGMTIGSMIEADRRLRTHELAMRTRKRIARDAEVWRRYEEDYQQRPSQDVDNSK
jgi:hypothetical protein